VPPLYLSCSKGNARVAHLMLDRGAVCDTDPAVRVVFLADWSVFDACERDSLISIAC